MLGHYGLFGGLEILRKVLLKVNAASKHHTLGKQVNPLSEQGMCARVVIMVG